MIYILLLIFDKLDMPILRKKDKKFFMAETRLLYSGGFYCMAEAKEAHGSKQIWVAHVYITEAHGVRGFPPSCRLLISNFHKTI